MCSGYLAHRLTRLAHTNLAIPQFLKPIKRIVCEFVQFDIVVV